MSKVIDQSHKIITDFALQIVMTAALGFDTWLAMRHGAATVASSDEGSQASGGDNPDYMRRIVPGNDLGCYYCNDVVAPRDVSTMAVIGSVKLIRTLV